MQTVISRTQRRSFIYLLFSNLKRLHVVADDFEFFFQFIDLPTRQATTLSMKARVNDTA